MKKQKPNRVNIKPYDLSASKGHCNSKEEFKNPYNRNAYDLKNGKSRKNGY